MAQIARRRIFAFRFYFASRRGDIRSPTRRRNYFPGNGRTDVIDRIQLLPSPRDLLPHLSGQRQAPSVVIAHACLIYWNPTQDWAATTATFYLDGFNRPDKKSASPVARGARRADLISCAGDPRERGTLPRALLGAPALCGARRPRAFLKSAPRYPRGRPARRNTCSRKNIAHA